MTNGESGRRAPAPPLQGISLPLWVHVSLLLLATTGCTAAALLWLPAGWRWLAVLAVVLAGAGFSYTITHVLRQLATQADAIRGFDFPITRCPVRACARRMSWGMVWT